MIDKILKYKFFIFFLIIQITNINAQDSSIYKKIDFYINKSNNVQESNIKSAIKYADSAYQNSLKLDNNYIIKTSLILGNLYKNISDIDSAKYFIYKAIELSKKENDFDNLIQSFIALGELNRAMYHSDIADKYIRSALQISFEKKIYKYLPYAYNRMAAIFFEKFFNKNIIPDSIFFKKSISYVDSSFFWAKKTNNYSYTISNYNILGAVYTNLDNYKKSNKYLFLALKEAKKTHQLDQLPTIYKNIGQNYFKNNEYDSAIAMGKKSALLADNLYLQELSWFSYKFLYEVYLKKKDYKNALFYLVKKDSITEISLKKNSDRHLKEFKAEFETQQTELLLESQKKEIIYQRIKLIIILVGFIITLILIFFVIIQSKKIKKSNESLKLKNNKIIDLTKFKANTQNMIVHDLKNPLSNILSKSKDKSIIHSAKKMLILINNILDVSKYKTVEMKINKENFKLIDIIDEILPDIEHACNEKGIQIKLDITNFEIYADKQIIIRVLENLLNNAIRFSPFNKIIEIKAIEKNDNSVFISVTNYGNLIEEKQLSNIFNMYSQAEVVNSKNYKSTGLGLSFCKMAIEAHGHNISARNIPPDKIIFEFTLDGKNTGQQNISKTIFKHKSYFTNSEYNILKPFLKELQQFSVFEITYIFAVLNKIPEKSENIRNWKINLKSTIFSANEKLYKEQISFQK